MEKASFSSLYCVTSEKEKYSEFSYLMGISDLKWSRIKAPEHQNMNLHYLVEEKIKSVKTQLPNTPFFVEHSGLFIDAWNELPGGLTRIFMDTVGNEVFCKMMQNFKDSERAARAIAVIGYYHPNGIVSTFEGAVSGSIALKPRGSNNFGWDPIFIPDGQSKTYGELSFNEKNRTSMRTLAVDKFMKYLSAHYQF
jgi:XTP/dITP diphosphohydrolase